MPIYEARCSCGVTCDYLRSVAEANNTPNCIDCGEKMEKVILSAPVGYVLGNFPPFKSVVDGSVISSNYSLREHNKRNNVVSLAEGYDDKTIKKGNFGKKQVADKNIKSDLVESFKMVRDGYKPKYEVSNDD